MESTREFHNELKSWIKNLPSAEESTLAEFPFSTVSKHYSIHDLDHSILGKEGVFFNMGIVMYELRRSVKNSNILIGHVKFLLPHLGALVSFFDDIQGIGFGEICLTKSLQVNFPKFELNFTNTTFRFRTQVQKEFLANSRIQITTYCHMFALDNDDEVLASSQAVYIQTPEILRFGSTPEDVNMSKDKAVTVWESYAPLRVQGSHSHDLNMSFRLLLDEEDKMPPVVPLWWNETGAFVFDPEYRSMLRGRYYLHHLQHTVDKSKSRGVLRSTKSAEGGLGLLHGGAACTACLEVVSLCVSPSDWVDLLVRFKRPISLKMTVVIECQRHAEDIHRWDCVFLDLVTRHVLQEYTVTTTRHPKL